MLVQCPELSFEKYLILEGPEPVYYVRPSVTPAVSGVRGADEQKTKFGPSYSERLQSINLIFLKIFPMKKKREELF